MRAETFCSLLSLFLPSKLTCCLILVVQRGAPPLPWELTGVCGGKGSGGIASLTQGLRLIPTFEIQAKGCCGVWFLAGPGAAGGGERGISPSKHGLIVCSFPDHVRLFSVAEDGVAEINPEVSCPSPRDNHSDRE